jgi:hypothetical protein
MSRSKTNQQVVLDAIHRQYPQTLSQVVQNTGLAKQAVSGALKDLKYQDKIQLMHNMGYRPTSSRFERLMTCKPWNQNLFAGVA